VPRRGPYTVCRGIRHDRINTLTVAAGGEHKVGRVASQMPLCGRFFYHAEPRLVRIEIVAHVCQPGERNATEAIAVMSATAIHRRSRTDRHGSSRQTLVTIDASPSGRPPDSAHVGPRKRRFYSLQASSATARYVKIVWTGKCMRRAECRSFGWDHGVVHIRLCRSTARKLQTRERRTFSFCEFSHQSTLSYKGDKELLFFRLDIGKFPL
jgi:hypothetical protein